jgi:glyoxylase-like metal-dependent hydrolase (beta-lactamase superfamily II)
VTQALDVSTFTVGAFAENAYLIRYADADQAILIDPGAEAQRLIDEIEARGVTVAAILVTHTHVDHIGAVAALAGHTGAPVYAPLLERDALVTGETGLGRVTPHEPEHLLAGGEQLELAGLPIDVRFTPGHSAGHLTYAIPSAAAIFCGDVLFAGSVGRVDLAGGDWQTLLASIAQLLERYPGETVVHPGHMSTTTLARERETNPFLSELRSLPA